MIDLTQDVHPLTDFKHRTPEFTRRIKETGSPLILTINGKPELVVLSIADYQQMEQEIKRLKFLRLRAELKLGDAALKRGDYTEYTDQTLQNLFDELEQDAAAGPPDA